MQDNRLKVQTPFGVLIAEPAGDPDYPGIYLYLAEPDDDGQLHEQTYALLESARETPRSGQTVLRLLVYANDESEEYSNSFTFRKLGQAKYDIWVEKQEDGTYAVRVWDVIGELSMPELEFLGYKDLPSAIIKMVMISRNNPDVQWHFRDFKTE